jgi:hypothetical protein
MRLIEEKRPRQRGQLSSFVLALLLVLAGGASGYFFFVQAPPPLKIVVTEEEESLRNHIEDQAEQMLKAPQLGPPLIKVNVPAADLDKRAESVAAFAIQIGGSAFLYPADELGRLLSVTLSPGRYDLFLREIGATPSELLFDVSEVSQQILFVPE